MNALVLLRFIKERLADQVEQIGGMIAADLDAYTKGPNRKPLPIVEYYDVEFRSFVNEVRRTLNKISEIFEILVGVNFGSGHFHKALKWSEQQFGKNDLLTLVLSGDQRWVSTWINMRTAIEHPKKDNFIETINFALEPNGQVRLPTWRFVNPHYDMDRPQNLLDVFEICVDNLLKFFEDLQILLMDKHVPQGFKVLAEEIPEEKRDQDLPVRYRFHAVPAR